MMNLLRKWKLAALKETDFPVDSTTKTNVQTKSKRRSQEMSVEKNKAAKKKLAQSKDIRTFFATSGEI